MKGYMKERSPGSWGIWIDVGKDETGKRRQKYQTVKGTKREAQREMNRLLAEAETSGYIEPAKITVRQYLERWLSDYAKSNVSAKTYERYAEIVEKHLCVALGNVPLVKLQPLQIQGYYRQALESGRRDGKGGLSAQTVLHHHRVLHAALAQAVRWRLVANNVADAAEPPRPVQVEMNALDEHGTAKLIATAVGTRLYLPVLVAVTTGLRLGEVLGLRWCDLDLDAGTLTVRQSLEETRAAGLNFKPPKTHRSKRPVALPSLIVDALRRHKGAQAQQRLLSGPLWQDHGLVCPCDTGEPWSPRIASKAFEHLADKAGVPQIRFQDLRHSHVSQLLKQGVHLKVVSERLGHARAGTTLNVYAHLLPGMQEDAALRVDASLRAAMNQTEAA